MSAKPTFHWDDPLLLEQQLSADERAVRDAARAYCQDRLAPRVLDAFRHEKTDPAEQIIETEHAAPRILRDARGDERTLASLGQAGDETIRGEPRPGMPGCARLG